MQRSIRGLVSLISQPLGLQCLEDACGIDSAAFTVTALPNGSRIQYFSAG